MIISNVRFKEFWRVLVIEILDKCLVFWCITLMEFWENFIARLVVYAAVLWFDQIVIYCVIACVIAALFVYIDFLNEHLILEKPFALQVGLIGIPVVL